MLEHGRYELVWSGDILHSTPAGNFNEQGIQKYAQSLAQTSAQKNDWILFLHLTKVPGLTPEALTELISTYKNISKHGCIAIAVEVPLVLMGFLESNVFDHLSIPSLESAHHEQLADFITFHLAHAGKDQERSPLAPHPDR